MISGWQRQWNEVGGGNINQRGIKCYLVRKQFPKSMPLSKIVLNVPPTDELMLGLSTAVLGRGRKALVSNDRKLLVCRLDGHLEVQALPQHDANGKVSVRVRCHKPLIGKHVQQNWEVPLTILGENELPVARLEAHSGHDSVVAIVTVKGDSNLSHAGDDVILEEWHLDDHVAIDDRLGSVPAGGATAGQRSLECVVGRGRGGLARGVQEAKVKAIKATDKGLGQSDRHVVFRAVDSHSLG